MERQSPLCATDIEGQVLRAAFMHVFCLGHGPERVIDIRDNRRALAAIEMDSAARLPRPLKPSCERRQAEPNACTFFHCGHQEKKVIKDAVCQGPRFARM